MEYMTIKEAAAKWYLSERTIQNYCLSGKIPGATNLGKQWLIPSDAEQPADGRTKLGRDVDSKYKYHFPIFIYSTMYNNISQLTENEQSLYMAQKMHLEGKYTESISLSKKIISKTTNVYIICGAYLTMGYGYLLLGKYSEYKQSLNELQKYCEQEVNYKEDLKLLSASLLYHTYCNSSLITSIDPIKLSDEAQVYYKYMLLMVNFLTGEINNRNLVNFITSDYKLLEKEKITPSIFVYDCLLGCLSIPKYPLELKDYHMERGIKTAISNNWLPLLAKFYNYCPSIIDKHLRKYDRDIERKFQEIRKTNIRNWMLIHKNETSDNSPTYFSSLQTEMLLLVSYNLTIKEISEVKGYTTDEVKEDIVVLCKLSNTKSLFELKQFAKNIFNRAEN